LKLLRPKALGKRPIASNREKIIFATFAKIAHNGRGVRDIEMRMDLSLGLIFQEKESGRH